MTALHPISDRLVELDRRARHKLLGSPWLSQGKVAEQARLASRRLNAAVRRFELVGRKYQSSRPRDIKNWLDERRRSGDAAYLRLFLADYGAAIDSEARFSAMASARVEARS